MDEMSYRRGSVTVTAKWDAGKLVDLRISADEGAQISAAELHRAVAHVETDMQADAHAVPLRRSRGVDTSRPRLTPDELQARLDREAAQEAEWLIVSRELLDAFREGKSSPVYLATLAKAFQFLSPAGGGARVGDSMRWSRIAKAIDRQTNTAKMHLVEARKEGYLSDSGQMTDKARQVLSK
ncbi:hypothetical protein ACFWAR_27885 [Streptomyces sp. NPDC059917]|uniref:hypothetical protein n=1 Tax=Streptomyces sp. NPDC059917 TaxID=3347002 RepID=UPI003654FEF4